MEGINLWLAGSVLVLMLFDIVTGIVKAFANDTFKSGEMRVGLYHKAGTLLVLLFSMFCTFAANNITEVPVELAGVYIPVCAYVALMEVTSVLENIVAINPELDKFKLFEIFSKKGEDDGE